MTPEPGTESVRRYLDAEREIAAGDLLLFRRRGVIASAGRGVHSHAAMAAWWGDDLFCLEVREFAGGRAVTLASQVVRFPGRIDVFALSKTSVRDCAHTDRTVAQMRRLAGCEYGWRNVFLAALRHVPLLRLLLPARVNDSLRSKHAPFCSEAVATAYRLGAGIDVVPNLADRLTEPADLARSPYFRYRFTLVP